MIMPHRHKTYQPLVSHSGIIQSKKRYSGNMHQPKRETKQTEADICLNCTREKCCGTRKCFERMKGEANAGIKTRLNVNQESSEKEK